MLVLSKINVKNALALPQTITQICVLIILHIIIIYHISKLIVQISFPCSFCICICTSSQVKFDWWVSISLRSCTGFIPWQLLCRLLQPVALWLIWLKMEPCAMIHYSIYSLYFIRPVSKVFFDDCWDSYLFWWCYEHYVCPERSCNPDRSLLGFAHYM